MGDEDHRDFEARLHLEKFPAHLGPQQGIQEQFSVLLRFTFELEVAAVNFRPGLHHRQTQRK